MIIVQSPPKEGSKTQSATKYEASPRKIILCDINNVESENKKGD